MELILTVTLLFMFSEVSLYIISLTPLFLVKLAVSFPNLFGDDIFKIEDSAAETVKEEW